MSFSSKTKEELCRQPITRRCCAVSECFGILLYCNTFQQNLIRIVTESEEFAKRLPRLFRKAFGLSFDRVPEPGTGRSKRIFEIQLQHQGMRLTPDLIMRCGQFQMVAFSGIRDRAAG